MSKVADATDSKYRIVCINGQTVTEMDSTAVVPDPGLSYFEVTARYQITTRFVRAVKNGKTGEECAVIFQGPKPSQETVALLLSKDRSAKVCQWSQIREMINSDTVEIWAVRPVKPVIVLIPVNSATH